MEKEDVWSAVLRTAHELAQPEPSAEALERATLFTALPPGAAAAVAAAAAGSSLGASGDGAAGESEPPRGTREATLVFVGPAGAGKTARIQVMLGDRDAGSFAPAGEGDGSGRRRRETKPTQALEYTFGRRVVGASLDAAVAHIWEMGGGRMGLGSLLEVALPPARAASGCVVVVVDLLRPAELAATAHAWLELVAGHAINKRAARAGSARGGRVWARYGDNHPDALALRAGAIPIVLVAANYDGVSSSELQAQRVAAGTLRVLAHVYGATLVYSALSSRSSIKRLKNVLNHYGFGMPLAGEPVTDHTKAVYVPAGSDSFEDIGSPPRLARSGGGTMSGGGAVPTTGVALLDAWLKVHAEVFGRTDPEVEQEHVDAAVDEVYQEPLIDAMRAEKEAELETLRARAAVQGGALFDA